MLRSYHLRITGPSGSGKTYMAERFADLGYPAIDANLIDGLGHFLDAEGNEQEYVHDGGKEWLERHFWSWNESALRAYLGERGRAIMCGGAVNDVDMDHLFDHVFSLVVPKDEILTNLLSPERFNPYGKTKEQQAFASITIDALYASIPEAWFPLYSRDAPSLLAEMEAHLQYELAI